MHERKIMTQPLRRSRWSWQLGSLFGIAIRVHATLALLLAWVAASYAAVGASVAQALFGLVVIVLVFSIVVIHELAHALAARHYGCRTREILLLPIGGLAQMERMPQRPEQELVVALAGPAVNVVLALVFGAVVVATGGSFAPSEAVSIGGALASQLFWINVVLAGFNLLPAFPMDGGRVLRALLAIRFGRDRATVTASKLGRVLAAGFVVAGLLFNPMLAIIGVFVWLAARQESAIVALRSSLAGVTVARAMIRAPSTIDAETPITQAAERLLATGQAQLAVTDAGVLRGIVTAEDVATTIAGAARHQPVRSLMRTSIPVIGPDEPLVDALDPIQRTGVAFVVDSGELIGLVTLDQLATCASFGAHWSDQPVRLAG
jgi:Zn-dependent protease/predicted transcriptional regulator